MNTIAIPHIELTELPDLVHSYLERALPDGGATPSRVRLTQEGTIQRKVDGNPLPFHAIEEIDVDTIALLLGGERPPVEGPAAPACRRPVRRRRGVLPGDHARRAGFPRHGRGASIGEAMRYLAELPWAPHAMLNPQLHWHVIDESIVEVETRVGSETASIAIRFNEAGDVIAAFGHRPHREGKRFEPRSWVGLYSGLPRSSAASGSRRSGEVHWTLPDGPFRYFRGTITGVELTR